MIKNKFSEMSLDEFNKFAYNELKDIENIELIILKGHIMIEYLLNCYLESLIQVKNCEFSKENFSFSQKIKIVKYYGQLGSNEDNIIYGLELLNKLRNSIAHTLKYDESYLKEFLRESELKNSRITNYTEKKDRIIASIAFIFGVFQQATINTNVLNETK